MKIATRVLGTIAVVGGGYLLTSAGPAQSQGANVIQCSDVFPQLGGVIIFQPNGGFKANCHEHLQDGTPGAEGETTVFDCSESFPEQDPATLVGIQVVTASGNILTNCHVHIPAP